MWSEEWIDIPFDEAVWVNPPVPLVRGVAYPFVDMQMIQPSAKNVESSNLKVYDGGGSKFRSGDTLMARITPCLENGKIARFKATTSNGLGHGSTEFIVLRGLPDVSDSDFVYYLTLWDYVRGFAISQMTGTSGRQRVPTNALHNLIIKLPPLPIQRAIAHILGTLDDKIELNRQMNATLEAIARALFKSWFVDLDPVRAKAEGRQPAGMDAETAALFPDAFVDSEEQIPVGWTRASILDLADLLSGGTPSTSVAEYWDGDIPWVSAKDVSNARGLFVLDTERHITTAGLQNSATKLLPAKTTIVTARGTVGSYCILGREMAMNQTNYALKAKAGIGDYFVYFSLVHLVDELKQQAYGTIFDTVTTKTFQNSLTILPPFELIRRFEQTVTPLMNRILVNQEKSRTLAALRDALLPKLMSGEMRIKDAEKQIAETV